MDTLHPPRTDADRSSWGGPPVPGRRPTRRRRAGGRRSRRIADRRRAERIERRHRLLRRTGIAVAGASVVVGLLVIALVALQSARPDGDGEAPADAAADPAAASGALPQAVVLLVRDGTGDRGATGLTLLSTDPEGGASAIFVPATSLVEIPGVGLDRLGLAQHYGGAALTTATVENALGIEVTTTVVVDDRELGALLDRVGGATLVVPERLVDREDDGTGTVAFHAGSQDLNGPRLSRYWAFRSRGDAELDTFSRQQAVLQAVLARAADPTRREALLEGLTQAVDGEVAPGVLDAWLTGLAAAAADERLSFHLLPVETFGTADERLGASYRITDLEAARLVTTVVPGAVPEGGADQAIPVQVLNGVGTPGVGQQVDAALEGLGFRIVLSDNARSFEFRQTQILIYDESPEMLAAAEQVRAAMGVGTILLSRQPQSVVDLTIVVGTDFTGGDPLPGGV